MRTKASRNAGLAVIVSARALNIREPTLASLGPVGDEAPAVGRHGAPLLALDDDQRLVGRRDVEVPPGSSTSGSAPKISASSDAGRCWVNRPHMAGKSSIVRAMDDAPAARPVTATQASSRPSQPGRCAVACSSAAATLLAAGEFADAGAHFARVVGFDDPAITAAALLGLGEARYRLNDEPAAVASWAAVLELPRDAVDLPGLAERRRGARPRRRPDRARSTPTARPTDGRPQEDKAEIANRLGWLSKETGNARASRRYFARGRGDAPRVTLTLRHHRGHDDRVADGAASRARASRSTDGSSSTSRRSPPASTGGCGR